jgi:hypothetical protein
MEMVAQELDKKFIREKDQKPFTDTKFLFLISTLVNLFNQDNTLSLFNFY